jgi:hypothetical protein
VFHAELQPGDAVMWQSYLWHYSPPNLSERSRIGMGACGRTLLTRKIAQRKRVFMGDA